MQIDKSQIIQLLKSQGKEQQAQQADAELPQHVDHEKDSSLLTKFGLDPADLMKLVSGGGSGGGLGGMLGR